MIDKIKRIKIGRLSQEELLFIDIIENINPDSIYNPSDSFWEKRGKLQFNKDTSLLSNILNSTLTDFDIISKYIKLYNIDEITNLEIRSTLIYQYRKRIENNSI